MTYAMLISQTFCHLVLMLCRFEQSFISVERIRQYTQNNEMEDLEQVKGEIKRLPLDGQNIPAILFSNVSLSYEGSESKNYALKGIKLEIKKGEKIAFCGRTGSGKTSILNILFRMYEIREGELYVDGQEVRSLSLK
jgi:ABC-type multidrug transport system fused ATPase/permease subunit